MRIGIASDLHPAQRPIPTLDCDVLVLAGDIGCGHGAFDAVNHIAGHAADAQIIYVAGNHEYYRTVYQRQLEACRAVFSDTPRIHYLEQDVVDIGGVRFLGCTLWTGFDQLGLDAQPRVMQRALEISDFDLIGMFDDERAPGGPRLKPFAPEDARQLYLASRAWLREQLEKSDPEKTVVVTHFPPALAVRNPLFPVDEITAFFQAGCEDLIERYQPACWIYGHNHWSNDHQLGKTRLISNQRGYPGERGIPVFSDHCWVDI